MRYGILGTTQVLRKDGTAVAVGGARLRALLSALALRAGRPVAAATLIDEVWDGDPPADAPGALQALVGRLRRALGHAAVESAAGGYRLAADREDVDLYRFERLVGEAATAGTPARAADLYDEALALWRGPALADLPDRSAQAARWEALRLDARRGGFAAALALGRAVQSLPDLAALCADHPLDEPLQALRIRALRDAGRQAEALAAYESVRLDLSDRLGADPGPALRALHAELLNPAPPAAAPRPGSAAPRYDGTAPAGHTRRDDGNDRDRTGSAPVEDGPAAASRIGWAAGGPSLWAGGGGPAGPPGRGADGPAPTAAPVPPAPVPAAPAPVPAPVPPAPASAGSAARPRTDGGPGAYVQPPGGFGTHAFAADGPAGAGTETWGRAPAGPGADGGPGRIRVVGNLRARLTTFVGRGDDIRVIGEDLAGARLVTLLGPGGAGKTRLSQEAAETSGIGDRWPDGVWLAELAPVDDPDDVPEAVVSALGARETKLRGAAAEELRAMTDRTGDDPVLRLVEHCGRRRMLLLLDNCEHVIGAAARLAEELLARCPGLQILATSREPLGVPGELLRPVEPLPDPMALRLFADRGAAARPGFALAEDPDAAAEICRRLDGLPLAIELAAARLRLLTPRQIADRLDDRFRLLTSGARTVLPRQQTLRAVVDWSWELLDGPERAVLRRLSVFAGGCDLAAAEAVCADHAAAAPAAAGPPSATAVDPVDPLDVPDVLGSLVDKSLVVASVGGPGEMRYRLLETVAEYAAERLGEVAGDRAAAERRHLVHYRELARATDPLLRGAGQRAALERLGTEYENLRTALRRAAAARDEHEMLVLIHALHWYWHMRDLRTEARHWAEAAIALGPDVFTAPVRPAPPVHERVTDVEPPLAGELLTEARRGVRLIQMATRDQTYEHWQTVAARDLVEAVVTAYHAGLPQACRGPGSLWIYGVMLSGDPVRLREAIDETVATCRRLGLPWELASALQLRANVLANRTDWAGNATRDADESLAIYTRLGDDWGAAEALSARGEARERCGEFTEAAGDFRAAIDHARRLGAEEQVTLLRVRLAGVLCESPDGPEGEEAEGILREIVAKGQHAGNEAMPAARMYYAIRLGRTGRRAEARAELDALRHEFAYGAYAVFEGMVLGLLGWLDTLDGRYDSCLELTHRALVLSADPLARMVIPQMAAVHLMTAAGALARMGGQENAGRAARLLGAYAALLPPGHFAAGLEREGRDAATAAARAALGDAAYEAAYDEGGGLTLEEATALF
ncbi:BTAD domain-containing putative transcriptional regulator [Streptomyces sp. NRRL S-87]|uniref:AfsR/SARP family transcriptional regulator n=1 Tax=Streptomyces sp. NRRL S-87 TaxID=1463920 RepID=UPI0004C25388|nr:BTAD domain-containing putative transcriptional regulator [Streptomyces sp. NRRL S-87]